MNKLSSRVVLFSLLITLSIFFTQTVFAATTPNNNQHHKPPTHQKHTTVIHPTNPNSANGTITAVTPTSITISSKQRNKRTETTQTITLNDKTEINKDLNKITINDLKIGDKVRIVLELVDTNYIARSIRVVTPETNSLIKNHKGPRNNLNTTN